MSLTTSEMTPADIAAVTGNNNSGDGMFGGNGAWWIIILFLFVFCGWGGNWGNNGGGSGSAMDGYVLTSDFATIERKLDSISNGICDSTFALNNTMVNGFANAELSRANQQASLMQQLYTMSMANQQCCCDTQRAIERGFSDTNYNLATQSCDTRNTIQNSTRDLLENNNANTRAILDKLTQQEIAAKDAQIAAQTQQIFGLQLRASQEAQNNYLVSTLRPCPTPAYITCNPWATQAAYGTCNPCGC